MAQDSFDEFRRRLLGRAPMIGSFLKTPSVHATEILGQIGFDFVVVDAEHGPFDRGSIDLLMLAAQASAIAGVVRVADETSILAALDMGAAGVIIPHIDTPEAAARAAAAARYNGGRRGFSPSARAGRYGQFGIADHVARADAGVMVGVMIEHPDAVHNVDAIAATDGIDALFLGPSDLAVAIGETSVDSIAIREAAQAIATAAQRHGKGLIAPAASVEAAAWLAEFGFAALVISSDQGLLQRAATAQLQAFRS